MFIVTEAPSDQEPASWHRPSTSPQDQGIPGMYVHEFVHDDKHLLGFPVVTKDVVPSDG